MLSLQLSIVVTVSRKAGHDMYMAVLSMAFASARNAESTGASFLSPDARDSSRLVSHATKAMSSRRRFFAFAA